MARREHASHALYAHETRLQLDRVQSEIERFKGMLQMLGETGEELQNVMRYLDERMRDLNRLLREIIQQEQRKQGAEPRDSSQRSALADKSFSFYTEDDIRRMNDAVARLAQRLKNRLSVRRKKAVRGRFNVKQTLRKNLQYGGVPSIFSSTGARRPSRRSWCCATSRTRC